MEAYRAELERFHAEHNKRVRELSDEDLARSVFLAAEERGVYDVVNDYLESYPDSRQTWEEYRSRVPEETQARQVEAIPQMFSAPDVSRSFASLGYPVGV